MSVSALKLCNPDPNKHNQVHPWHSHRLCWRERGGEKSTRRIHPAVCAQNNDAVPLHCPLVYFRRKEQSCFLFTDGGRTVDGAAPRYSPARSLLGAADDPSLRNQLQQPFLSGAPRAGQPSKWAPENRDNSCTSHTFTVRKPGSSAAAAAAVRYLFTLYLHQPIPSWSDEGAC